MESHIIMVILLEVGNSMASETINYSTEMKKAYKNKMKSKLFGLLNEYEKNREWESFLNSILIELMGFEEESKTIDYYILVTKLSALRFLSYKYFRQTIFDCMSIIERMEV